MEILLLFGIIILAGFVIGKLSHQFKFPSVVGYIVAGILIGPSLIKILHFDILNKLGIITDFALGLIAITIGMEIRWAVIRRAGKAILTILFVQAFFTYFLVFVGLYVFTRDLPLSLILGALAVPTAPAGTVIVLREYRARGKLTSTLLAVVGLDDGLAIIMYGCTVALLSLIMFDGKQVSFCGALTGPLLEIGGAILLGIFLGVSFGYFIKRLKSTHEILTVSLASIFICTGLALTLHFSVIMSCMILGVTLVNLFPFAARRTFESLQDIATPIYVAFFVIAGAHLQFGILIKVGFITFLYIILRAFAKLKGASLGAVFSGAEEKIRKYLGWGLFSQAGVAVGLAIIFARNFGAAGDVATKAVNIIAGSTIILELLGPLGVKYAVTKAGEIKETN